MFEKAHEFPCETSRGTLRGYAIIGPEGLPKREKKRIFQMLYPVALSAFSEEPSRIIAEDVFRHLFAGEGLIVVTDTTLGMKEFPVAFRMWEFVQHTVGLNVRDIMYLAGMCVQKDYQGIGIGKELLKRVIFEDTLRQYTGVDQVCALPDSAYVALRTQNPVMKQCFDAAIEEQSYPQALGKTIPSDIVSAAVRVAKHLGDEKINQKTLITKGLYKRCLYDEPRRTNNKEYQRLFDQLNQERGDAMVCVWRRK